MAINKRQFTLLNAMGIDLWARKNPPQLESIEKPQQRLSKNLSTSILAFNLDNLSQQPFFNDILLAMNLTNKDISDENNELKLKQFIWHFSIDKTITYQQRVLSTPSIEVLATSPQLKRQLWQTMINEKLICH